MKTNSAISERDEVLDEVSRVTSQIAHDIRSPLTALKVSLGFLNKLPDEERLMIRSAVQRIEDIANNLAKSPRNSALAKQCVPEIEITKGMTLTVLDDDLCIHQIWQRRVAELKGAISLLGFSDIDTLEAHLQTQPQDSLFLFDYELLGQKVTGLDLIRKWNLERRAILVTSHFDEANLQQECEALGLRILPKFLMSEVPIRISE